MSTRPFALPALAAALIATFTGCATSTSKSITAPVTAAHIHLAGSVHGGQQPVTGAAMAFYAAGSTGTASAARSMLTAPVVTDSGGNFSITGDYTCQPGDQVYLTATGGDSGAGINPHLLLMTALGPCSALSASTRVSINEVTTVASVYALSAFMSGVQNLGAAATPAAANALSAAFANVRTMVDPATGLALSTSTGAGVVPLTTIHSLANSLASCVNSTSASTVCNSLFQATTVPGSTPTDTLQAALNLAHFPSTNPAQVYNLADATPPFQPTLQSAPASYAITVQHLSDVLTYHNDNARTGAQTAESTLTPANVNPTQFGKLFTYSVDSYLFANPLYIGGLGMPDGVVHNLVLAASTRGTVYAFDADGTTTSPLWTVSLLPAGDRYPTGNDYGCNNPPEAAIVGTPVIDRTSQTLYVVVKSINATTSVFTQSLHALSLLDGSEQPNSPRLINPTFSGSGAGSSGGAVPFNAQRQLNRAALLLAPDGNGGQSVWVAFASHCDIPPYHGIVVGYNAANLQSLTATLNNTPNGNDGGIWMGAGGLAADAGNNLYALGGNGTFDVNTGGSDYGDSAIKLSAVTSGSNLAQIPVADYFTPSNQASLQQTDSDLGGAEGLLITDSASGPAPHLLVASDKAGYIYLINTDTMGHYRTGTHGPDSLNGDVQDFGGGSSGYTYNFAFYNNTLYTSNPVQAFAFTPGNASSAGSFNTTAVASTSLNNAAPVISANGNSNAILWLLDQGAEMHAFTTPNLTELYKTSAGLNNRDRTPNFVKFTSPVIANGKLYLSGQGSLAVYGLLP